MAATPDPTFLFSPAVPVSGSPAAPAAAAATTPPAAEPTLEETMATSPDVANYTVDGVTVGRRSLQDQIDLAKFLEARSRSRIRQTHFSVE